MRENLPATSKPTEDRPFLSVVVPAFNESDNVAHAAHLGGLVVGFVWMKFGTRIASRLGRLAASSRARKEVRPGWRPDEDEAEVDRILKKIHEEGIDSLTPREKMFLQDASRRRGRRGG